MPARISLLIRYVIAAGFVALATCLRIGLGSLPGATAAYSVNFLAIALATWFGGIGPGLAAAVATVLLGAAYIPDSDDATALPLSTGAFAVLLLRMTVGAGCALVVNELRHIGVTLRRQRDMHAATLAAIADAVVVVDAAGEVVYLNPAAQALTGRDGAAPLSLAALLGLPDRTQVPRETRELTIIAADGSEREVALRTALMESDSAAGARSVIVLRDLTGSRQAERERIAASDRLAASERQLKLILDANRAPIFHVDRDFRLTWANRAMRLRYGLGEEAGVPLDDLLDRRDLALLTEPLRRALADHYQELESNWVDPAGITHWTYTTITPERDAAGAVRGCVVLQVDTTRQHRAEAALRRGEDQKRVMLENLPNLVWMAAPDGTCEWFNRRWGEYTGRHVADWTDAMHPDDREGAVTAWLRAQPAGKPFSSEARYRRSDGVMRWHLVRMQPLQETTGSRAIWGWCGSCTDIDDQKRAATTLRTTQMRISAFLGALGHELRNPLAAMSAATQIVRHPRAAEDMTARALDTLERQTALLARMVEELLDAARLMEGRIDLQRRSVALDELLAEVCTDLTPRAQAKNIDLHCDGGARPLFIDGDLLRVKQAVENLVLNAIDASNDGGRVEVTAVPGRTGEAGVRVRDHGRGIPAEELATLFEPGKPPLRRRALGLGLGHNAASRIVQRHGGRITAASEGPGTGATFELFFPLHDPHASDTFETSPAQGTLLLGQRVLLIANSGSDTAALIAPLERCGAQVHFAGSGFEGLRTAASWSPTAVVCDLDLPAPLSGCDVAGQLAPAGDGQRPRLIALADEDPLADERAGNAGFDQCLHKPVALPRLLGALAQAGGIVAAVLAT